MIDWNGRGGSEENNKIEKFEKTKKVILFQISFTIRLSLSDQSWEGGKLRVYAV
jgi:hypothetical protein